MKQLLLLCLVLCLAYEASAFRPFQYAKKVWKSDRIWSQITQCTAIRHGAWFDFILEWLHISSPEKTAKLLNACTEKLRKKVQEGVKDPLGYIKQLSNCGGNGYAQFDLFWFFIYLRRTLPC